jgi:hypothetical protein
MVAPPKEEEENNDDDDDAANDRTETLIFKGVVSSTSKELPTSSSETILQFLQEPRHRNLILTAGGKRPIEQIDLTLDVVEEWKRASRVVGSSCPPDSIEDPTAALLKVQSGNINFAGVIQITSLSRLGCRLCLQKDDDAEQGELKPVYETTLLGDERTVSGLAPMVYIYNKLTGGGGNPKKESSGGGIDGDGSTTTTPPTKKKKGTEVTSLSRVTYQRNTDKNTIVFTANAQVTVAIQFPAFLLKILPTNKEKAEASGGSSISKALVKDVDSAIQALGEAYEAYLLDQK